MPTYLIVTVVGVLVDSGKAQNENEAKRLREGIPAAIGRSFQDRRGALLLVSFRNWSTLFILVLPVFVSAETSVPLHIHEFLWRK